MLVFILNLKLVFKCGKLIGISSSYLYHVNLGQSKRFTKIYLNGKSIVKNTEYNNKSNFGVENIIRKPLNGFVCYSHIVRRK